MSLTMSVYEGFKSKFYQLKMSRVSQIEAPQLSLYLNEHENEGAFVANEMNPNNQNMTSNEQQIDY